MTRIPSRPRAARRSRIRIPRPRVEVLEERCLLANFLVTSADDSGPGPLRQAILDANTAPGADQIAFDIPGPGGYTITSASALPIITDPVVIDGTTQPGFDPSNHRPVIELDGSIVRSSAVGLDITAGHSTVRGLVINRFNTGIRLRTNGGDRVEGNEIGTDVTGTVALTTGAGITIQQGSNDNTIGGTAAGAGNLLSGNIGDGLNIFGSMNDVVRGNFIGTDATGTKALGNANGVSMTMTSNALIGGATAGARNVISGNVQYGVGISSGNSFGSTATGNVVQGNYISIAHSRALPRSSVMHSVGQSLHEKDVVPDLLHDRGPREALRACDRVSGRAAQAATLVIDINT